ncbi:hypothetical protein M8J77_018121 [Diaphorina citri]|nr:hypothetical protein M8J77_018121 [Diaphorina citri]
MATFRPNNTGWYVVKVSSIRPHNFQLYCRYAQSMIGGDDKTHNTIGGNAKTPILIEKDIAIQITIGGDFTIHNIIGQTPNFVEGDAKTTNLIVGGVEIPA